MTVPTTTSAVSYTGTGLLAVYPYTWQIAQASDLVVYRRDTTGLGTLLNLNTDYTVSGAGVATGGNVTLLAGNLTTGYKLLIASDPAQIQSLLLTQGGNDNPADIMAALDLLTREVQANRRLIGNSLQFPVAESLDGLTNTLVNAAARASKFVSFDTSGNVMAATGAASVPVSTAMTPVVEGSTLAAARAAMGPWSDALVTSTGSTTARDLQTRTAEVKNAKDYGAVGDGVTNDTAAITAAITAATAGQYVYLPTGSYLTTGITIGKTLTLLGDGADSILIASGATATVITVNNACTGVVIRDLQIQGTKTDESSGAQTGILTTGSAVSGSIRNVLFAGTTGSNGLNNQINLSTGSDDWQVTGCRLTQCIGTNSGFGYGMLVNQCNRVRIVGNEGVQSSTQGRHHVYLSVSTNYSVVEANVFSSGTNEMITINANAGDPGCNYNVIKGNTCSNGVVGGPTLSGCLSVNVNSAFNLFEGNTVYNCGTNGVMIQGGTGVSDPRATDNAVIGNLIYNAGTVGILLKGCDRAYVASNYVYESSASSSGTYYGLQVSPGSANTTCTDNKIIGNALRGTTNQRGPWNVASGSGVRPSGTIIFGNDDPPGKTKPATDDGSGTTCARQFTVRKTFLYSDFSTAATTNAITIYSLNAGEKIKACLIKHSASFTGGTIGAYTVSVGIAGTAAKYAAAFDVFQAIGSTKFQDTNTPGIESMGTSSTNIIATATSTGANLSAATAGSVDIYLTIERIAHLTS